MPNKPAISFHVLFLVTYRKLTSKIFSLIFVQLFIFFLAENLNRQKSVFWKRKITNKRIYKKKIYHGGYQYKKKLNISLIKKIFFLYIQIPRFLIMQVWKMKRIDKSTIETNYRYTLILKVYSSLNIRIIPYSTKVCRSGRFPYVLNDYFKKRRVKLLFFFIIL